MPVRRLVTALRELFQSPEDTAASLAVAEVPPVPLCGVAPAGWRPCSSLVGPYERFTVHYPRDWSAVNPGGDPVHLQPAADFDLAVTITSAAVGVSGPQGLLDALETLAEARGLPFERSQVRLDRWQEDGWAGSWSWRERQRDGRVRRWRVLLVGHDQHLVYAMVNGAEADVQALHDTNEAILATLELPASDLLAPEHFPVALAELLNDRRMKGEPPWMLDEEGSLVSGPLVVRLFDLYRVYLMDGDLDAVARALDERSRRDPQAGWAGRSWAEVQDELRVVLRRREAVEPLDVLMVPLDGDVVACPVLDSEDRMTFIPSVEAERWGVTPQRVLRLAIAALEADATLSLEELRDEASGAVVGFRLADGDGYDSGRLLCPAVQRKLSKLLGGSLTVAMPTAGLVLVVLDEAVHRLDLSGAAQRSFRRRPRPLSERLWRWTEQGLEPA